MAAEQNQMLNLDNPEMLRQFIMSHQIDMRVNDEVIEEEDIDDFG